MYMYVVYSYYLLLLRDDAYKDISAGWFKKRRYRAVTNEKTRYTSNSSAQSSTRKLLPLKTERFLNRRFQWNQ